jgi:sugar lactone lactonase YvrE
LTTQQQDRVKRTHLIGALAAAAALLLGGAIYYHTQSTGNAPRALQAVLKPFARTVPDWRAYVAVLAGEGVAGVQDGAAGATRFHDPYGVAVDTDGTVYVADGGDSNRIRKVARDGTVSTVAGGAEGFADGPGSTAAFNTPSAIALDRNGNLYVADTGNHAVRKVARDGAVTTLAGGGQPGFADGQGAAARFNGPVGIAVGVHGAVYVADTYNDRIRRIAPDGTVTTLAGTGKPGMADGPAAAAAFDTPTAIAVARDGTLFVADTGNDAIRRIGADGTVSTFAAAAQAERGPLLRRPVGLALARDGWLYVSVGSGRILQVAPDGSYHALEHADDTLRTGYGNDGTVRLFGPRGVALDGDGSVVVADAMAYRVERLAASKKAATGGAPPPPPQLARREPMPWPVAPQF